MEQSFEISPQTAHKAARKRKKGRFVIKQTDKQTAFIENYCNPDSDTYNNATQSAVKAGYSEKTMSSCIHQILSNNVVMAGMKVYRADTKAEIEHTRDISLSNLQLAYDLALTQGNPASMVAAEREKNAISNLHSSTVNTGEGDSANLTDEQRRRYELMVKNIA